MAKGHETLEQRVETLEAQMRMILRGIGEDQRDRDVVASFARMTPRMHGALQCILNGIGNREIAQRFHVQESTAKVYVRSIAKKLGVRTRSEIVAKALATYKAMSDEEYLGLAKISKHWFAGGESWSGADDGELSGAD
jgi:DNA-binding NarL/FixJ family response regulator